MYDLALFAGAGGGILGGILCGHTVVGAVEIESYPRKVLLQRQRDGILPEFPVWDDICTFRADNPECREYIKKLQTVRDRLIISGGFPCQDISAAGKCAGIDGTRSGLWSEMARVISEIRPAKVLVENSPLLVSRGLDRVLSDLAEMGYNATWGIIGGYSAGLAANGLRLWIVAYEADCKRRNTPQIQGGIIDTKESSRRQLIRAVGACSSKEAHSALLGNTYELARDMDRLKAVGNGQVPDLVRLAINNL